MQAVTRDFGVIHVQIDGPAAGPAVVFANSLGTDLRLWDRVLPLLPQDLRYVRFDQRGHGLSAASGAQCTIEDYADDALAVIEAVGAPVVFVGLSIGGLIAQAVAAQRPDLIRALILSNTAARLGTADSWAARIAAIQSAGLAGISNSVMERWFAPAFRETAELSLWKTMFERTSPEGYIAACHALANADQTEMTAALTLPTLVIAGSQDGASPRDIVQATADLIAGARFAEIKGAGHLPCVETPHEWAKIVTPFLEEFAYA